MLRLLVIRHAPAGTREEFASTGKDDSLRPLTRDGKIRMEGAARGLRRAAGKLDLVATSPFVRAAQTARIVAEACGGEIVSVDALVPTARPAAFLAWLREHAPAEGTIAAVGHEPHLGRLTTWLLTGIAESHVCYKKGGACLIEFARRPQKGGGELLWALPPGLARRIT